jgi:hypothetical protein
MSSMAHNWLTNTAQVEPICPSAPVLNAVIRSNQCQGFLRDGCSLQAQILHETSCSIDLLRFCCPAAAPGWVLMI